MPCSLAWRWRGSRILRWCRSRETPWRWLSAWVWRRPKWAWWTLGKACSRPGRFPSRIWWRLPRPLPQMLKQSEEQEGKTTNYFSGSLKQIWIKWFSYLWHRFGLLRKPSSEDVDERGWHGPREVECGGAVNEHPAQLATSGKAPYSTYGCNTICRLVVIKWYQK